MSTPQSPPPQELPGSFIMITRLGLVSFISGLLIVLVFQLTLPNILENKRLSAQESVFKVLTAAASSRPFRLLDNGELIFAGDQTGGEIIHAAYDAQGKLVGVALEAEAQGYQNMVSILYGFDPERQCITGIDVLKSAETPGLGAKIGTDKEFLRNFDCLDASINAAFNALNNPIRTVKHGAKQHPWEIDAISGATISSKAVGRMLNDSGRKFLPTLMKNLQILRDNALHPSGNRASTR